MSSGISVLKSLLTCAALLAFRVDAPGQVEMRTLLQNGPAGRRLNIVYLAEGYVEEEKSQFFEDAEQLRQYSLTQSPYSAYVRHFNVYAIFVPSAESGSDHPSRAEYHDTYFNSTYDTQGIARLVTLTGDGHAKVIALLAAYVPEYDFPVVIVNDTDTGRREHFGDVRSSVCRGDCRPRAGTSFADLATNTSRPTRADFGADKFDKTDAA
jgi:hypothetical protein